jgi:phage terminase large subunit GpA-like protein
VSDDLNQEHYALALSDACSGYEALKPPNRVSISQGAKENLVIKQTGAAGGHWDPTETPYMVHPMDSLASRQHEAVVFVGPARTGKTAGLLLGWMAHNVVNDPGDMLFIQMTKDEARKFSKTDVDRALRNSPHIREMQSTRAIDSNTFDTMFRHGMFLRIGWPTINTVSGSTYRYVAITDIDRMENADDVDGEGPLFDLAKKRTTTFLSRGMCLVESSPGYPQTDPAWKAATPHEGPPVGGIGTLYNRSDRHRWYWQCPDCSEHFEAAPGLGLFHLPDDDELLQDIRMMDLSKIATQYARVICPHCGSIITPAQKNALNANGLWLPDNVHITREREIIGTPLTSKIRGYWMGGVAATYQPWTSLIYNHLEGLQDYALTGSEKKLKQAITTDQAWPYMDRHLKEARSGRKSPQERAENELVRYQVPPETRMLNASVDVQGGVNSRFVVQLHAVGPHMEQWLVDRHEIKLSKRPGMGQEFAPLDPASYPEDWDLLTEKLLDATWRTPDPDKEIRLRMLTVDTGGEDGVTAQAYTWYRRVRKAGKAHRVTLYKGSSQPGAPIVKESMVGSRKGTKGDIPLLVCNPNLLSDMVSSGLKRGTPGPGYYHFPAPKHPTLNPDGWLQQAFFDELEAEVRAKNGTWQQVRKRNESFDLCRMMMAGLLRLQVEKIRDWNAVPAWLAPLDLNSEIVAREDRRAAQENAVIAPPPDQVRTGVPPRRRPRRHGVAQY